MYYEDLLFIIHLYYFFRLSMEGPSGETERLSPSNWKENVLPKDGNVIEEAKIEPEEEEEKGGDECDKNEEVRNCYCTYIHNVKKLIYQSSNQNIRMESKLQKKCLLRRKNYRD